MIARGGALGPEEPYIPDPAGPDEAGNIRRGDIYSAELRDCAGDGRKDSRPVLVVQNDIGNRFGNSVIVACVTTSVIHDFPVIVEIPPGSVPGPAAICLNQIITMDKGRLGEKLASLPAETMAAVDEALGLSLGLPRGG